MKFSNGVLAAALVAACSISVCAASDWPQYSGPNKDRSTSEKILEKWPETGLKQVWKNPTPDGFSSFSVGGGVAATVFFREGPNGRQETCVAYDAESGKELWAVPFDRPPSFQGGGDSGAGDNNGGDGPRTTPAIDGGFVYVTSAYMVLNKIDAKTGKVAWTKNLATEAHAKPPAWSNAESPLIEGNLIFVCGGGADESLMGIDKNSGTIVWKGESDQATHATPVVGTILGKRQVLFMTQKGIVSVQPEDGKVLWRFAFPFKTSTAASPVISGDLVYCGAGYNVGSAVAQISKNGNDFAATELWRKTGSDNGNHWSTPVAVDGYIYGIYGHTQFGTAPLKCIDAKTGEVKWSHPGFGPGNVIIADGKLVVLSDSGSLVLAAADPSAYKELARAKLITGKCWSTPVVSNGKVYVRSTKEGGAFDISKKMARN